MRDRSLSDANIMRQGNNVTTEEGYKRRIEAVSSKYEYISNTGKTDRDYYYLLCKDCGNIIKKSKILFKPSRLHSVQCNYCMEITKHIERRKVEETKRQLKQAKEAERQKRKTEKQAQRQHICKRCGKSFEGASNKIYCSTLCARRQSDSNKEHKRRIRALSHNRDTISLELLYKRDKGICWICGRQTNYKDYVRRIDRTFIAGDNYPSIDHVIPLAKGGTHTWNNVRLAHRECNTKKNDSMLIEERDSQLKFVM